MKYGCTSKFLKFPTGETNQIKYHCKDNMALQQHSIGFCQVELILRCFEVQKIWLPLFSCQSLLLGTNVLVDNCAQKSAILKSSHIFENLRLPYKGASFIIINSVLHKDITFGEDAINKRSINHDHTSSIQLVLPHKRGL